MLSRVTNCNISTRPIPEDESLDSDSSSSSECELNLTQDRLGMSAHSGLVSGTSSRRVVINDTPKPLGPGDKKHRALYSSGHDRHSPPRSILRTPSVKAKSHIAHRGSTKKDITKQVDILRVHSNTSDSKMDFPTRKVIQNPFPVNTHYKYTMETIPQHDSETNLVSFLKQLLREFQNLVECLALTNEELSQARIDQTPISTMHDSLTESLGELNLLINNRILAKEEVDYLSIAEILKLVIGYLIMAAQGLSEQCWKVQEEVHSVNQERKWLQQGKESLLQEQQALHHVFEISKAQLISEKNEMKSQQDSIAAAKLELLKRCNTVGNRKLPQAKQKVASKPLPSVLGTTNTERVKHTLEMSNLREANMITKAELAVAKDTVLQLRQQMEKQYQESQKKTSDLTRRLQQAEGTIKMAAETLGNESRKYLETSSKQKPKVYDSQKTKPQNSEHGKYKKQQRRYTKHDDSEQLWERASKFVQETGGHDNRSRKTFPQQSELTGTITAAKRSKKTTTIHSYNKPSTASQVAKWLNNQHT